MDGFTLIDGIVALVIVVSALLAYSRGFVREALSIAGWIGAAILASVFASQAEPLVKELPVIGGFIGESCELAIIAAFAAVFALALVIMSIITPLFHPLFSDLSWAGLIRASAFCLAYCAASFWWLSRSLSTMWC